MTIVRRVLKGSRRDAQPVDWGYSRLNNVTDPKRNRLSDVATTLRTACMSSLALPAMAIGTGAVVVHLGMLYPKGMPTATVEAAWASAGILAAWSLATPALIARHYWAACIVANVVFSVLLLLLTTLAVTFLWLKQVTPFC